MGRPPKHLPGEAPTVADRLRQSDERLRAAGGRRLQLRLRADELAALELLTADGTTARDAIAAAILAAAHRRGANPAP